MTIRDHCSKRRQILSLARLSDSPPLHLMPAAAPDQQRHHQMNQEPQTHPLIEIDQIQHQHPRQQDCQTSKGILPCR